MAKKIFTDESLSTLVSEIKTYTDNAVSGKSDTGHTHDYAGSSEAGGAATSAVKLHNAKTINGVSFDGTSNIKIEADFGVTTSGSGAAYTATVKGINSLTSGVSFIMIPHTTSTSASPTLNVNGLGAKSIKRRTSVGTSSTSSGNKNAWLYSGRAIRLVYDGTAWIADMIKPDATDITGTLKIANGGTGATTAANALINLGLNATAAELNYCDGVTSNIQAQLDALAARIALLESWHAISGYGDIYRDGHFTQADIDMIHEYMGGDIDLTNEELARADVNGDGDIDVLDAMLIAQRIVGDIDKFPVEE